MSDPSKLKMSVTIEGCPYEDRDALAIFSHASQIHGIICDIDNSLRSRLKHEDIPEKEYEYLESLRNMISDENIMSVN